MIETHSKSENHANKHRPQTSKSLLNAPLVCRSTSQNAAGLCLESASTSNIIEQVMNYKLSNQFISPPHTNLSHKIRLWYVTKQKMLSGNELF